jgi:cytochrome c-type biogenesis protein CcmH/NrfG
VQRLAVLPAEVLIGDPASEWMKLALPLVLQEDLAVSRQILPFFAKNGSAAYAGQASEVLRTTIELRDLKYHFQAVITDPQTQKNLRVLRVEASSGAGIALAGNLLAKQIDVNARDFPTRVPQALMAFTLAAETQDLTRRMQLLHNAVSADPAFGLAYIALVETAAQAAPQDLPAIVAAGTAHQKQFAPLERARWSAFMARYSHAPLRQQADTVAAVLKIAPNNVDALGTLGVDRFLQGHSQDGEQLLRRAMLLNPANVNFPLQLANGLIESRRFSDAIGILKPLDNSVSAIPALAAATLLQGNTKEASAIFQNLINVLPAGAPSTNTLRSQWEAIAARSNPPALAPATPWTPGYQAFLNGRFEEAAQFWRNIVQQTGDTDLRARAMLAASLNSAGHTAEAKAILVMPFVPDFNDANIAIAFNHMRQLLGL